MPVLASEVMNDVRAALNDVAIDLYSNEVQLPYLKIANDDLSDELIDHGSTVQKEVDAEINVLAGATTVVLPDDIVVPISMFVKNVGDEYFQYRPMKQALFVPNTQRGSELVFWDWRNQEINLVGSTIDKVVRLRYNRLLTAIIGENSPVTFTHSKGYLAYHTAALLALHVAQNQTVASILESQAEKKLTKLLKREVKQNQARPVRRRAFRLRNYGYQTH